MLHFVTSHYSVVVNIVRVPDFIDDHLNTHFCISVLVGGQKLNFIVVVLPMQSRCCQKAYTQLVADLIDKLVKMTDGFIEGRAFFEKS